MVEFTVPDDPAQSNHLVLRSDGSEIEIRSHTGRTSTVTCEGGALVVAIEPWFYGGEGSMYVLVDEITIKKSASGGLLVKHEFVSQGAFFGIPGSKVPETLYYWIDKADRKIQRLR